ncbi:hypothetical protein BDM02DRAFT_563288 [Thelephora ganbajun]|uniref:Uncharacterized protein n=1 Tax=Thelephora ganbajun TaxID=370292 RepID=A0ACB6ZQJ5_THEGA|nr:hypothetical protein BDM02DRAFT_563288 [Thelephora ganbajun]
MLQTFSINLLFNNARFYLSPSSGTPLGSRSNSYESLKDISDTTFSTPSPSHRTSSPEVLSPQTTFPSLAPPATTPIAVKPSLPTLPFPPSQASLAPKPDSATPSLLDTSISFARMMDRTESPASFLTCSSGWDPGIVCGAATFPSLLHSRQSIDNFCPPQEIHYVPNGFRAEAECPLWEDESSQASQSPSKLPFTLATPFYFPPSLRNAESARLKPSNLMTSTPPRTALETQLPSRTYNKYSPTSPQTTSPGSEFSLPESTTSSTYHGPFHWDTVLAGLPPSPQHSPALEVAVGEPLPVRLPTPTSFVPSAVQCHPICAHSPERDSVCSTIIPGIIPTIVVLNPDSVMVPTQASVSSIIGLYGGRRDSTQTIVEEIATLEPQAPGEEHEQELDEGDTDGEDSCPESEFEIVAVPALKVRLDTILETDEMDLKNAFSSLMTLGSVASGSAGISAAEERTSTEFLANGCDPPSFSTLTQPSIDATSVFSSGQIVQSNPEVSASTSFASTAKLYYAQSGTSISGESTTSSYHPTASGSESDCPWLLYVEDGKILEVPRSTPVHGGGKFADKLARFPNVPKSPQMTLLPSPSPANQNFFNGSLHTPTIPKKLGGTATLDTPDVRSLLSPYWERNNARYSTGFAPGISAPYRPITPAESLSIAEILRLHLGTALNSQPLRVRYPTTTAMFVLNQQTSEQAA